MRGVLRSLLLTAAVAAVLAPGQVSAEGYVSPFTGANFGNGVSDARATFGVSAGYMGAGVIGGEFDFGYMTVRAMSALGLVKPSETGADRPSDVALAELTL